VRLLGVGAGKLEKASQQLELWDSTREAAHSLLETQVKLRQKSGGKVVQPGKANGKIAG
jgi:hypothetical protein